MRLLALLALFFALAAATNAVIVTFNYRLGALGHDDRRLGQGRVRFLGLDHAVSHRERYALFPVDGSKRVMSPTPAIT